MNDYHTLEPDFAIMRTRTRTERMPSLVALVSGYFEAYDVHTNPQGWLTYDCSWELHDRNVPFDPITGFKNEYAAVRMLLEEKHPRMLLEEKLYYDIRGKRRLK